MKKTLIVLIVGVFMLGMVGLSEAALVSFLLDDGFVGVDGDTTSWSHSGSSEVNLGVSSWSLLSGDATVYGYSLISGGTPTLGNLTHRWDRGLGVLGGENDEIDYINSKEGIKIVFNNDYYLNSFELRSLFIETEGTETGRLNLLKDGVFLPAIDLYATETSGNGIAAYNLPEPILVDELRFTIKSGLEGSYNDFAVARLDVTPVPEPTSMMLLGMGILGLFGLRKKVA